MKTRKYFAAANGYTGFRSYFDRIFDSRKFDGIYVLKGGPGTGKSTLMKNIAKESIKRGYLYEEIYCSSDPSSLDGVTVESEKGHFAILDGTAPHERDAVFPGAIDYIVNLGESFIIEILKARRDEILSLCESKRREYKAAYEVLHSAERVNSRIKGLLKASLKTATASSLLLRERRSEDASNPQGKVMLKRAFCKRGYYELEDFIYDGERVKISGDYDKSLILLNFMHNNLRQTCRLVSYDPLDEGMCDAFFDGHSTVFASNGKIDSDSQIDAEEFFTEPQSKEETDTLLCAREDLLGLATKHFLIASTIHAELESIYSSAMNFDHNATLLEKIINNIF